MAKATKKLSPDALAVLGNLKVVLDTDNDTYYATIQGGQLDRKVYVEVNAALETMGGKWNKKQKAHTFSEDPAKDLDLLLVTGEFTDKKKLFQFYETPNDLADEMVRLVCLKPGMRILEPSVGDGAIFDAIHRKIEDVEVVVVELDEKRLNDFKLSRQPYLAITGDFLNTSSNDLGGLFDRVIMNPPFTKMQDSKHVRKAYSLLKPGGLLIAVMSAAVIWREAEDYNWIRKNAFSISECPEGTFKASGTNVNTAVVVLEKT